MEVPGRHRRSRRCSRSGRPWPGPGTPRPRPRRRSGRRRSSPARPGWGSRGTSRRHDRPGRDRRSRCRSPRTGPWRTTGSTPLPASVPLATSVPVEVMVLGCPPDDIGSVVGEQVELSFGTFAELAPEPKPDARARSFQRWRCPGTVLVAAAIFLRYSSGDRVFLSHRLQCFLDFGDGVPLPNAVLTESDVVFS